MVSYVCEYCKKEYVTHEQALMCCEVLRDEDEQNQTNYNNTGGKAMRPDIEILEKHFPTPEGHEDTERILAAMKEAREEYAILFLNWLHEEGYEWGNKRYQLYRGGKYFYVTDLKDKFNTHMAAIEAEKERGKG